MEYRSEDVYMFQLVNYFVKKYNYQIVTVKQQKNDVWLINPRNERYPVIRLSVGKMSGESTEYDYIRSVHRILLDLTHREGKLLAIRMDAEENTFSNENMDMVCMAPTYLSDMKLNKTFTNIDQVIHEVKNNQDEFASLTRSLEEFAMKKQKFHRPKLKEIPRVTLTISLISIFLFLVVTLLAFQNKDIVSSSIISGAYYKMNVVVGHEYWRLITSSFVHFNIFQLMLNLYALYQVSTLCERLYSKRNYIIIVVMSVFVSNLFILIAGGNNIFMGLGPVFFGMLAAYIVSLWLHGGLKYPLAKASVFKLIMICVIASFTPGSSWIGHIGGIAGGGFIAAILTTIPQNPTLRKNILFSSLALLIVVGYMAYSSTSIEPIHKDVDQQLLKSYRATGLNDYAKYLEKKFVKVYESEEE